MTKLQKLKYFISKIEGDKENSWKQEKTKKCDKQKITAQVTKNKPLYFRYQTSVFNTRDR